MPTLGGFGSTDAGLVLLGLTRPETDSGSEPDPEPDPDAGDLIVPGAGAAGVASSAYAQAMHLTVGVALGLVGSVFAAPAPACAGDGTDVVLQPYEIVYDGKTSTTTITRTYTGNSWSAQTVVPPQQHGSPASPGVPNPCINCITITTTGSVPYVTTVPPASAGGRTTVFTCSRLSSTITIAPPPYCNGCPATVVFPATDTDIKTVIAPACHECVTVTVSGTVPWVTTVPPTSSGDKTTVFTCPGQETVTVTGTVSSTTTINPTPGCSDCTVTVVIPPATSSPATGLVTTITRQGTTTGLTTLPATSGGTTTVITFMTPPGTGGLTTKTVTESTTGLTTLPATSGGTTTIVTYTTPPRTTVTSKASTTGLTTLPATSGGTITVITFTTPQQTTVTSEASTTATSACSSVSVATTVNATLNSSGSASFQVPACATSMSFSVTGGSGVPRSGLGGNGAILQGSMPVVPGQSIQAIAGGQGLGSGIGTGYPGQGYGNGGNATQNGGTGGAESALFVGGNLVVVAGGGGGCYSAYGWHLDGDTRHTYNGPNSVDISRGGSIAGLRGSDGFELSIKQYLKPGNEVATMLTTSGPGAAGDYISGVYDDFVAGQPGKGQNGGNGGTAN
ncbi:FLO9-Lectin, expressed and involved in flocculation, partial [Fusarium agapanthi]